MPRAVFVTMAVKVVVLAAAAALGAVIRWDAASYAFLVVGLINTVAVLPGTRVVRAVALAGAAGALAFPLEVNRAMLGLMLWLVWPPAFLAAWAIDRGSQATVAEQTGEDSGSGRRARLTTAALIGAVAFASLAYRILTARGLQQTAALFVGIPACLAIAVVLVGRPRTAVGVACKAVTVGLLVSLMFLGEGLLCIVMSAPLFYTVAVIVALAVQRARGSDRPTQHTIYGLAVLVLVPMTLEGVTDRLSFSRDETVSETRVVHASADDVRRALFETPRFDRVLPPFLRAGFPRPIATTIETAAGTRRWVVDIRGGETRLNGQEPAPGRLVLDLVDEGRGHVAWRAASDDSHMPHFLRWRDATVQWQAIDAHATRVTWTLRYRRGLDPAWYFGPWERYAARLAARYLIETVATP